MRGCDSSWRGCAPRAPLLEHEASNTADPIDGTRANVAGLGPGCALPVDTHPTRASVERALNLAGNVFEWVEGPYRTYDDIGEGRSEPASGRELRIGRGGCFHIESGYLSWERTTFRHVVDWGCIGIRCCALPFISDEQPGLRRAEWTLVPASPAVGRSGSAGIGVIACRWWAGRASLSHRAQPAVARRSCCVRRDPWRS